MKTAAFLAVALSLAASGGAVHAQTIDAAQMQSQLAQAQAELAQHREALGRANAVIAQLQAERDQAKAARTAADQSLEYCQAKNVYLIGVGGQILDRYRRASLGKALLAAEPFTGLMRVRLENAQQEYQDQIRAGRFDPRLDRPVAATASAPAALAQDPAQTPPAAADNPSGAN